jgi:hypothetical protein
MRPGSRHATQLIIVRSGPRSTNHRLGQLGYTFGPQTPVISRRIPGNRGPRPRPEKPSICRDILVQLRAAASACHAEGRGFESHQPLQEGRDLQVFSIRQPASASASPCTQCAPAGLDMPVGAEKDRICRSFADARTTDLLRGRQKGQGFESRGPRVARSAHPQCSCPPKAALSGCAPALRPMR